MAWFVVFHKKNQFQDFGLQPSRLQTELLKTGWSIQPTHGTVPLAPETSTVIGEISDEYFLLTKKDIISKEKSKSFSCNCFIFLFYIFYLFLFFSLVLKGSWCLVVGWGHTGPKLASDQSPSVHSSVPMKAFVPVAPIGECRTVLSNHYLFDTSYILCAGFKEGRVDTYQLKHI